jgi:hypothetical protein
MIHLSYAHDGHDESLLYCDEQQNKFLLLQGLGQQRHRPQVQEGQGELLLGIRGNPLPTQKLRARQKLKRAEASRKKANSLSVLVRSEQERELLSFFELPALRKSKSKSKVKSIGKSSQNPELMAKTPLEKILGNKGKFMKTYFSRLRKFEKSHRIEDVKHVFPDIALQEWTVKGYLMNEHIMLKAVHESGRERYLKYKYSKYVAEIKTSYEEFVKEKFEEFILASYAL